jgi:hypothetical protein
MEDRGSMTTFYYCSVNHQSGLQSNTFSKLSYIFFNTSKCATNFVILFEIFDGFIGQKILKLWRQESWPFGSGWAAHIKSIHSWTFLLPWVKPVLQSRQQALRPYSPNIYFLCIIARSKANSKKKEKYIDMKRNSE